MSTRNGLRHETRKQPPSIRSRWVHLDDSQGDGHRLPAYMFGALFEKDMAPIIGGGVPPNVGSLTVGGWTVTTGGTNDAIAAHTNGGLLLTAASDDNFDMTLDSVLAVTPTTGKWYSMVSRIAVSGATALGFKLGLTTGAGAAALPFGTNYTDVVAISKAIASANVVGTARGNSGTAADSSTLGVISTAEVEVGFAFYLSATVPQGFFSYKTATAESPTITAFTSDQLTQVAAILTSPPTMYWTIHITGVTATNPTLAVASFMAGGDR